MEQLVAALEKSKAGTTTEEVKQAEEDLKRLSMDGNFVQAIQSLLENTNCPGISCPLS